MINQAFDGVGEAGWAVVAPVQRQADLAGETSFGTTGVALPKAAASSTANPLGWRGWPPWQELLSARDTTLAAAGTIVRRVSAAEPSPPPKAF